TRSEKYTNWRRKCISSIPCETANAEIRVLGSCDGRRRCRRGRRLRFHSAPTDRPAAQRFAQRAEQHHVHHLAVVEALQNQRRQQRPILILLQRERDHARQQVDEHENREENQRPLHVLRGPELRQPSKFQLTEPPQRERQQKQQVDHWRNKWEDDLKKKNIRNSDPAH